MLAQNGCEVSAELYEIPGMNSKTYCAETRVSGKCLIPSVSAEPAAYICLSIDLLLLTFVVVM